MESGGREATCGVGSQRPQPATLGVAAASGRWGHVYLWAGDGRTWARIGPGRRRGLAR